MGKGVDVTTPDGQDTGKGGGGKNLVRVLMGGKRAELSDMSTRWHDNAGGQVSDDYP